MAGGANKQDWFKAVNPKSKVPTLTLDDGSVLTEFGPIGVWLARNNPDARLLPTEPNEEFRALSTIDYVVGTIHGQGFGRIGVADAALFYATRWAPQVEIELPPNLSAHFHRRKERPAVRRVITVWGEA